MSAIKGRLQSRMSVPLDLLDSRAVDDSDQEWLDFTPDPRGSITPPSGEPVARRKPAVSDRRRRQAKAVIAWARTHCSPDSPAGCEVCDAGDCLFAGVPR